MRQLIGLPVRLLALGCAACLLLSGCAGGAVSSATPENAATAAPLRAEPDPSGAAELVDKAVQAAAETGTVLPETADAGRSYVDSTLFIGDSNTVRYMMYADDTGEAFASLKNTIGVVSMGVGAITTLKCEQFKGYSEMFTVPKSVAMLKPQRIIICYGTNNLSGSSTDASNFISTYLKGLKAIEDAWPYADIIVSAIPPLDKQRENQNLTMTQVDAYNAALIAMCEENGFKFLNSSETLKDSATGWAKTDYTLSDGVHLSKLAVTAYFDYVRTHAYVTEDRRPQPLGTIPEPQGSPVGLISSDPIAVRGAKVPVEFVAAEGGSISGAASQLVKKGASCSAVTAVPNEGWTFTGWSASYGSVDGSETITFTVPATADAGGVILTAHFEPEAHDHNYAEVEGTRTEPSCEGVGGAKYQCSICGETIAKELPALGHDWDGGVVTQQPQIGVEGVKTYTCRRCGKTWAEAVAALEPAPHEHSYIETERVEPSCTAEGSHTLTCSGCGSAYTESIPVLGHDWDGGAITQPPQVGVAGIKTYVCMRCGQTLVEEIPALEPTPEPPVDPPTEPPAESGGDNTSGEDASPPPTEPAPEASPDGSAQSTLAE